MNAKYNFKIKSLFILLLTFSFAGMAQVSVPIIKIEEFIGKEEQANAKLATLEGLIVDAKNEGFDVLKEKMTVQTAKMFLLYANWDEKTRIDLTSMLTGIYLGVLQFEKLISIKIIKK